MPHLIKIMFNFGAMKILLIYILLSVIGFTSFGQAITYPTIKKTGQSVESFVPNGWFIFAQTNGDLNMDGKNDVALVVQNKDPKFIKTVGKGDNAVEYDANHRILIVLFQTAKGTYTLADYHNTLIWRNMTHSRIDPFLGIAIEKQEGKKGVLIIDFHFYYESGENVNEPTTVTYKFRYQNNAFELIGAEKTEFLKKSGSTANYSFDFLGKKVITTIRNSKASIKETTKTRDIEIKTLKNFRTLFQPLNNNWEVNKVNL